MDKKYKSRINWAKTGKEITKKWIKWGKDGQKCANKMIKCAN